MAKLVVACPSCGGDLRATRLACGACGTNLEGQFDIPVLLQLPPDDLSFVVEFVRLSGSLKAMAAKGGTSYPTVRNRLDQVIQLSLIHISGSRPSRRGKGRSGATSAAASTGGLPPPATRS